jgi:hypothetical protein
MGFGGRRYEAAPSQQGPLHGPLPADFPITKLTGVDRHRQLAWSMEISRTVEAAAAEERFAAARSGTLQDADAVARKRTIWILLVFGLTGLGAAAFYFFPPFSLPPLWTETGTPQARSKPQAPVLLPRETSGNSQVEFADNVDRLNYALASSAFSGGPAGALITVRARMGREVCPFIWRNDQVTMTFTGGDMSLEAISSALSRCTDAIEKLQ